MANPPVANVSDANASSATVHIHRVTVHFGDCDPAGIVFFPNFLRWMDQSSLAFFMACGVPPWRELVKTRASWARRCWRSTPGF